MKKNGNKRIPTPYERVKARLHSEVERGERRSALMLCVGSLTLLVVASVLLLSAAIAERRASGKYIYTLGESTQEISREIMMQDGVQYADMYALADAYGIEHSTVLNTRASFRSCGTELILSNGSDRAVLNGIDVSLAGRVHIVDGYCLIPLSDIERIFYSANIRNGEDSCEIKIDLIGGSIYMIADVPEITYETDVSGYLEAIRTVGGYVATLANKQNPVGGTEPEGLVRIPSKYAATGRSYLLYSVAETALEAMMNDMFALGYEDVYVTSAYRSYEYQESLFSGYIEDEMAKDKTLTYSEAREKVLTYSSEPGKSEHQTGLCVDFTTLSIGGVVDDIFESTDVFLWLRDNSWKYGFVMRYPSDKTDITGYAYESWHYRFVGLGVSSVMHQTGMCYEEYLESFN